MKTKMRHLFVLMVSFCGFDNVVCCSCVRCSHPFLLPSLSLSLPFPVVVEMNKINKAPNNNNTTTKQQQQHHSTLLHQIHKVSNHHLKPKMSSRAITPLGIIILLHSAYSCLHYRSIISSSSLDDFLLSKGYSVSSPPKDVVIEVLLGFFLCLLGQMISVGKFLPVVGSGRIQLRAPAHISRDFDLFCTRAKIIAEAKRKRKIAWWRKNVAYKMKWESILRDCFHGRAVCND